MKPEVEETCPRCKGFVWHRREPCRCKTVLASAPEDVGEFLRAVGARVRACREAKGLSLDGLAARARMSKTGLWQIETGASEPMARTLYLLADALDVTADFLLLRANGEAREVKP